MTEIDPIAVLEQAARQDRLAAEAKEGMEAAITGLVMGKRAALPFFATVALRMPPVPDWTVDTMATDGKTIAYNPEWVCSISHKERAAVVAHEVLHKTQRHHLRRRERDFDTWNRACDIEINPILLESGLKLPGEPLLPGRGEYRYIPPGLAVDEIFDLIWAKEHEPKPQGGNDQQGQDGQGQDGQDGQGSDPGGCGAVKDFQGTAAQQAAEDMDSQLVAVQAAEACKGRGDLPAGIARLIGEIVAPKTPWEEILREYVSQIAKNDYSWRRPNRRYIQQGIYLPSLRSEELGDVVVVLDTSGSISGEMLQRFAGEVQGILEPYQCRATVLYHHHLVYDRQEWSPDDGPLVLHDTQAGGTSHEPVFQEIDQMPEEPVLVIALTDMDSCFPSKPPAYPVIWARVGKGGTIPVWGTLVDLD